MKEFDKLEQTTLLVTELNFHFIAGRSGYKVKDIYEQLIKLKLDEISKGFWVLDFDTNVEVYSPGFRETLGFENEVDFPNHPESWRKSIQPIGLEEAEENLNKHIATRGKHPYAQKVVYNKKSGGEVELICHGNVVMWNNDDSPKIMIGWHL